MLGLVPSASLLGIDGHAVTVEVHISSGLPVVHRRRPARRVVPRGARPRPGGAAVAAGCDVAAAAASPSTSRRPRSARSAPGSTSPSPSALLVAVGQRAARRRSATAASSASSASTARVRPVPGTLCLDAMRSATASLVAARAVSARRGRPRRRSRSCTRSARWPRSSPCLRGEEPWPRPGPRRGRAPGRPGPTSPTSAASRWPGDALEVAAAGGHHLLLLGPPGAGKTMLAAAAARPAAAADRRRGAGDHAGPLGRRAAPARRAASIRTPPFRAPHHGASVGRARRRRHRRCCGPGEISLATSGVLFLDELAEFPPSVLDALRQPLEEGVRAASPGRRVGRLPGPLPARRRDEPVPVRLGSRPGGCRCSEAARPRYLRRLSGPLLDRFDLRVEVHRPRSTTCSAPSGGEPTRRRGGPGGRGPRPGSAATACGTNAEHPWRGASTRSPPLTERRHGAAR